MGYSFPIQMDAGKASAAKAWHLAAHPACCLFCLGLPYKTYAFSTSLSMVAAACHQQCCEMARVFCNDQGSCDWAAFRSAPDACAEAVFAEKPAARAIDLSIMHV